MIRDTSHLALALLATGLLTLPARAQTDPPPPPATTPAPAAAPLRPLERLRDSLALTPSQLPLWLAYVGRLDSYTQQRYREKPQPAPETASATQQLAHLVDLQQNRLAALEDIELAVRDLYVTLTPAQRKLADEQLIGTVPVFAAYGAGPANANPAGGHAGGRPSGPPPKGTGMRQPPGGGF